VQRHLVDDNIKPGMHVKRGDRLSSGNINPHKLLEATKDIHSVQNFLTEELHGSLFGKLGVRRRNVEVAVRSITNLAKVRDSGGSDYIPGDVIPRSVLEEHNRGVSRKDHVQFDPILKGTGEVPLIGTSDWMQRLNYQRLHTTLQGAAAKGEKSDIHSTSPIPALAYGAEFGRPPPGKPKYMY